MDSDDVVREMEAELKDMGVTTPDLTVVPVAETATPQSATTQSVSGGASPAVASPTVSPVPATAPVSEPATPEPAQAATVVPPIPTLPESTAAEHHEIMGQMLTQTIQRGKNEVPHMPDPLVAKPRELESWRVFKIMSEFVEGFELLRKYSLAATFFGSARRTFAPHFYSSATELATRLAKSGFAVITGGSAGIMEAANKGAYEAGGASIGLNIRLEMAQGLNQYLTDSMTFDHFFVRKVMLTFSSEVYIYFPGGFGTLDEFTEIVTLVQTRKIHKIPIVLFGREYWEPFTKVFEEKLFKDYGAVDAIDLELYRVVDSVDEAYDYIMKTARA
jgi:uncharacterized protein (TIGR00730 family)